MHLAGGAGLLGSHAESLSRSAPASCSSRCVCYATRRRGHAVRPRPTASSLGLPVRPVAVREPEELTAQQLPTSASDQSLAGARHALERMFHLSELWTSPSAVASGAFLPTFLLASILDERPSPQKSRNTDRSPDFFANVGDAIRTLREDIPMLFQRDLSYEIYREDIVFRDPRNCFKGLKNYQTIFWSLQFHGKIFFKTLYVDVKRIWQPEDLVIKMRWTVHGIPRVPWEAEGTFDGISTYRLDNTGRIYEHSVDNVLLRDPPMATNPPLLAGLNLVPLPGTQPQGQQPIPGAWFGRPASDDRVAQPQTASSWFAALLQRFSFVRLYAALVVSVQLLADEQAGTLASID